jgi:hypothetical protein
MFGCVRWLGCGGVNKGEGAEHPCSGEWDELSRFGSGAV